MPLLQVFSWALIFLFTLRFPPGSLIAPILKIIHNNVLN